jgi:hypothetical protein
MESSVLPSAEIVTLLSAKFICLKVDADNPGPAEKMLSQVKGNTLPFYAYVSPDAKFISGTSGFRSAKTFKADLEGVLKNDALRVPAELEKKLVKMADQAAKDFEAKKTAAVLKAARDADAIRGFSDSKDKIKELLAQVLEGGQQRIKEAAQLCGDGKFDEAASLLASLAKDYKGTDVERVANAATKAVDRLRSAAKETDAKGARRYYELIVKECKDAAPFVELAEAKLKE